MLTLEAPIPADALSMSERRDRRPIARAWAAITQRQSRHASSIAPLIDAHMMSTSLDAGVISSKYFRLRSHENIAGGMSIIARHFD